MQPIPFPASSTPGQKPGEGQGRLINCYAEKLGDALHFHRAPGLHPFSDTLKTGPRGMIDVNGTLYGAFQDVAVTVDYAGSTTTQIAGALSGSLPVTWARNNKSPTPDVVCVTENGAFSVTGAAVSSFADPDLPQPNSVSSLGGYLMFTIADGRIFATDLNSIDVNALSFATAESNPDGLLRGTSSAGLFWAWGQASCEVWGNVGTSPFPLARQQVIPVGLLSPWAIAGFESGWDLSQIFVAQDGTVRRMNGYQPEPISTPDVQRAIQSVSDKTTIHASVHVVAGHPIFVLSSPVWTWCYDASTDSWFERQSYGLTRWRGETSVKFADKWLVGDTQSGKLLEVTEAAMKEDTSPLVFQIESGPVKSFPLRMRVPDAFFDFTVGQGNPLGAPDEVDPQVGIQWSHDGGASWSNTILQKSLGQSGQFSKLVRQNRIGRSTHHGVRFRLLMSSAVYVTFRGGMMDVAPRKP